MPKTRFLAFLVLTVSVAAQNIAPQHSTDWKALEFLVGKWEGPTGQPGHGTNQRVYEFGIGGTFLVANSKSVYPPQKANPKGEVHVDHTVIGYDKTRKKFVMRQFHVEGFVNQYVLDEVSADGKKLVWITESIENIAPGWRAKETWTFEDASHFSERFDLAPPGKDFEMYAENHLHKATRE